MSRNLCQRNCDRCGGVVEITGPTDKFQARRPESIYVDEYRGMLVADAECQICGALYLAWITGPHGWPLGHLDKPRAEGFVDLSYRKSFNDEPADEDVPPWATPRDLFAAAERQLASIVERRAKNTAGRVVAENLYQYATGMMYGAMEVLRAMKEAKNRESGRPVSEWTPETARLSAVAKALDAPGEPDITISGRPERDPLAEELGAAFGDLDHPAIVRRPAEPLVEGRFAMPLVTSDELTRRDGPPRVGRGADFPRDDGTYVVDVIPDPPRAPTATDCPSCDGRGVYFDYVNLSTTNEKRFFACKACDGTGRKKGESHV
jgi:hypothetical protein